LEQKTDFEESIHLETRPQHRQSSADPKRPIGIHFGEKRKVGWRPVLPARLKKLLFLKYSHDYILGQFRLPDLQKHDWHRKFNKLMKYYRDTQ